jgi:hypothetical protein
MEAVVEETTELPMQHGSHILSATLFSSRWQSHVRRSRISWECLC